MLHYIINIISKHFKSLYLIAKCLFLFMNISVYWAILYIIFYSNFFQHVLDYFKLAENFFKEFQYILRLFLALNSLYHTFKCQYFGYKILRPIYIYEFKGLSLHDLLKYPPCGYLANPVYPFTRLNKFYSQKTSVNFKVKWKLIGIERHKGIKLLIMYLLIIPPFLI